ncbi:MAG: thioredoxin family protein [Candidatus Micrarchaeota archaeon]|nr:thioredoxin family protein [Candidatus Micrarchaeota archaeon]
MPVIDGVTYSMLEKEFAQNLKGELKICVLTSKNCQLCSSLTELCRKISEASKGRIIVSEEKDAAHSPGIRILDNLVYMGIPTGRQTWVFVNFLMDVSRGYYIMGKEARARVMGIGAPVQMDVYVSAGSQCSPLQARLAYECAALNKNISVRVIDGMYFPEITMKNHISAVPTTIINNRVRVIGGTEPDELVRKINEALK